MELDVGILTEFYQSLAELDLLTNLPGAHYRHHLLNSLAPGFWSNVSYMPRLLVELLELEGQFFGRHVQPEVDDCVDYPQNKVLDTDR